MKSLADGYEGKRFNAPNDLVIDRDGGIYFTDPHFRAPMPLPQGVRAFYYRSPDGKVTRLAEIEAAPNGIILSPDEKTLYVIPSLQAEMLAYPVEGPGKLGQQRVFCTLQQASGKTNGGGDGLKAFFRALEIPVMITAQAEEKPRFQVVRVGFLYALKPA